MDAAKAAIRAAQDRQKAYAYLSRRDVSYSVGQEVLLSTRNIAFKGKGTPKLMPKWIGPLPIKALSGPKDNKGKVIVVRVRAVELTLPPLMRVHPVFHVSLIKEYKSDGSIKPVMPLEFDTDGAPLWEVEVILNERKTGKKKVTTWYLVRWKGFGPEHDTWTKASEGQCKTLIDDYHRRNQRPQARRPASAEDARASVARVERLTKRARLKATK